VLALLPLSQAVQFHNLPLPVLAYIFGSICDFSIYILSNTVVSLKKYNAKQRSSE
jgi:hypothetical protein